MTHCQWTTLLTVGRSQIQSSIGSTDMSHSPLAVQSPRNVGCRHGYSYMAFGLYEPAMNKRTGEYTYRLVRSGPWYSSDVHGRTAFSGVPIVANVRHGTSVMSVLRRRGVSMASVCGESLSLTYADGGMSHVSALLEAGDSASGSNSDVIVANV